MSDLDVNNVRARIYNNGGLFWRGQGNVYTVPKDSGINALSAAGIWVGGLVDGELRFAGTDYGPWEFWPGPLDDDGNPPADCSDYDRIYNVYRSDLEAFIDQGVSAATDDILDWPAALGAPFVDTNGDGTYRPEDGDYPEIQGDQTLWWVMNDAGNVKTGSKTKPIGLEVQTTVWAEQSDGPLDNATIYKYRLIYKGSQPLEDAYFGIWADPDLGEASDDFVGSDTLLNMGFVFNGDSLDEGKKGYGARPPALGIDLIQGPLIPAEGVSTVDPDGTVHPDSTRRGMTTFLTHSGGSSPTGHPKFDSGDPYRYLRGIWRDDTPITSGGIGYGGTEPTTFMYPGDPAQRAFWSAENTDGHGHRNTPSDQSSLLSTGPFTMQPGEVQEIVFTIVWARGNNRLQSIIELRKAANVVQSALGYGEDTIVEGSLPSAAPVLVSPGDGASGQFVNTTLRWRFVDRATHYHVQLSTNPDFTVGLLDFEVEAKESLTIGPAILNPSTQYFWRVRGTNAHGNGPWSESWSLTTSEDALVEAVEPGIQTIVEISIGDSGALEPDSVWLDPNHEGYGDRYYVGATGNGSLERLYRFYDLIEGDHDFEIRFTDEGGYGVYAFEDNRIATTPFELWDIGFDTPADPSDDRRMIPFLFSLNGETTSNWGWGTGQEQVLSYPASDAIYFMAPLGDDGYEQFAATADAAGGPGSVYPSDEDSPHRGYFIDHYDLFAYPIGRLVIADYDENGQPPPSGTIIRIVTNKPDAPQVPALSYPADQAAVANEVDLWWESTYSVELQVAEDPGFNEIIVHRESEQPPFRPADLEQGEDYYWRVRSTNARGTSDWSSVWSFSTSLGLAIGEADALPERFTIQSNYPNPFAGRTTIRYGLPKSSDIALIVFDVLGRRVSTLERGVQHAGWHEVTWDADDMGAGVYFIRLDAGGRRETHQVILLR